MTLETTDLIAPTGRLQDGLFPAGDITDLIDGWLVVAYAKADSAGVEANWRDDAAEAYVYYLAYSHVADRLASEANRVSVDSAARVEKAIDKDRIDYFSRLAQKYLDDFNVLTESPKPTAIPRSTYVQTKVIF